jgi:hypothetical protein
LSFTKYFSQTIPFSFTLKSIYIEHFTGKLVTLLETANFVKNLTNLNNQKMSCHFTLSGRLFCPEGAWL